MNIATAVNTGVSIERAARSTPILVTTGRTEIAIRAGTTINTYDKTNVFDADTPIAHGDLVPGSDYGIQIDDEGTPFAALLGQENPIAAGYVAGFHFAPGGCAEARAGGDVVPAINPHSLWDIGFRPSCTDPRGMATVEVAGHRFWIDIYLLGVEHKDSGTSRHGVKIADGGSLDRLNFKDAAAIMSEHGKRLPTYEEFHTAAFGVTERSSADRHPKSTGLDAARTSRFGLMQATGNLWVWGTDGDPNEPRPSLFGGSWISGGGAGSRYAGLGLWAGDSHGSIGARGASDHLSPE